MSIFTVIITKYAKKDLLKVPAHIVSKLQSWIDNIEKYGLNETRKISGYHDEPLKGYRIGQRSIRLSKAYRAIYITDHAGKVAIVNILEVNKHEY